MLEFSKEKQTAHKRKRKNPVLNLTESELQTQLNDTLDAYRIKYIRIPDFVWYWIKRWAPLEVINALSRYFGGMPDNIALIPLGKKYSLVLSIELKAKGRKKHGKQKHWQSIISRSPEDSIKIIEKFIIDASQIKERM